MRLLLRVWATLVVTFKRVINQPGLVLATTLGIIVCVGLTMSIPVYTDAVYYNMFRGNLNPDVQNTGIVNNTNQFALTFAYMGNLTGLVRWEDTVPADTYLRSQVSATVGLKQTFTGRFFESDNYQLFPGSESVFDSKSIITWTNFAMLDDVQNHISIQQGNWPAATTGPNDTNVQVMISSTLAAKSGLQPGEKYLALISQISASGVKSNVQIPVVISGVWQPTNAADAYWFINPSMLDNSMLVTEDTFSKQICPQIDKPIYFALWQLVMDDSSVRYDQALNLLSRIAIVQHHAETLLPNISLFASPTDRLVAYQQNANLLTVMLVTFSIPILGLLLAFINLTAGFLVERRRNEIAVLRSRGATSSQVVGMAFLESSILAVIALLIGIPVSLLVARMIGQTRSFLDLSASSNLNVILPKSALYFGIAIVVVALLSQTLPTFSAARHTIISYKQERSRMVTRPWWQRAYLDFLLLIPAAYGFFLLRQQGTIKVLNLSLNADLFSNPLLFLVPALTTFALTLIALRLIPPILGLFARLLESTRSVGLMMAVRFLSRTPGFYAMPLMMLILTLSLSAFTASLASTLDNHLHDQIYYNVGADIKFAELGENNGGGASALAGLAGGTTTQSQNQSVQWTFLPVTDYLKVPGVEAATRVATFPAALTVSGSSQTGVFMGIDRFDFAKIGYWRSDFSDQDLGSLMNLLAQYPNGVLVPHNLLGIVNIGDTVHIDVTGGQAVGMDMQVVGTFNLFPTWYPDSGPLFLGNLDYLYQSAGTEFPYEVWLKVAPGVDPRSITEAKLEAVNIRSGYDTITALTNFYIQQEQPGRQGIFGLLSIGFSAAALLTVLVFFLYALFSFQRRFIEMGVLRAIGLSAGQMVAMIGWEIAFLILLGGGIGTGLGIGVSRLFIPFLQIGTSAADRIPPFVVEISWPAIVRVYVLFGAMFLAALSVLVVFLRRMKIFQAIKMGETA
jgi:putative ABC transport system permease protein